MNQFVKIFLSSKMSAWNSAPNFQWSAHYHQHYAQEVWHQHPNNWSNQRGGSLQNHCNQSYHHFSNNNNNHFYNHHQQQQIFTQQQQPQQQYPYHCQHQDMSPHVQMQGKEKVDWDGLVDDVFKEELVKLVEDKGEMKGEKKSNGKVGGKKLNEALKQ